MKDFLNLTKTGIVLFVMISGLAGFAISFPVGEPMELWQPLMLLVGLYLVSSGSFALNQAQEWHIDSRMPRTQGRPVAQGRIRPWQAYSIGILMTASGALALLLISAVTAGLAVATVVLYNGLYTLFWKRKWAFGAVPGAVPGAMPVVIGYSVNNSNVFSPECAYLFVLMFLWQMPHFWALAIRFRSDYKKGGVPVLPVSLGVSRTLYHIGLYLFAYCGIALAAPWFLQTRILYLFLIVPIAIKLILEFLRYYADEQNTRWLPFFLWVNLSILVFLGVPAAEKWLTYFYFLNF